MSPGNKSIEDRLQALEKCAHEPYDFTHLEARIAKLENPKMDTRNLGDPAPEYDCDFYYFKPGGKWKYEGAGFFPDNDGKEEYYDIDHDAIFKKNKGMPGISSSGKDLTVVVIPRAHCKAKFAYPRMIKAKEEDYR